MKRPVTLALAASLGAGLLAGTAQAQDFRAFDEIQSQRASSEDAVRVRFTLPFGQNQADRDEPRLAFGLTHDFGAGQTGNLDLVSFSLSGDTPRVETPFRMNANGDDGAWYTRPTSWLIIGAGVAVAWAVYDHNQDDDDEPTGPM